MLLTGVLQSGSVTRAPVAVDLVLVQCKPASTNLLKMS